MGSRRKVVNSKLVDTLGVAKLSVQSFPDIEPLFVRSHITDLGRTWRILNKEGTHHGIEFNENKDLPVVVSGWIKVLQSA